MPDLPTPASADDPTAPAWMSHPQPAPDGPPTLCAWLTQLKQEIRQAITEDDGASPSFQIRECTAELALTWTIQGSGQVALSVLDFGATARREATRMVTITLRPIEDPHVAPPGA